MSTNNPEITQNKSLESLNSTLANSNIKNSAPNNSTLNNINLNNSTLTNPTSNNPTPNNSTLDKSAASQSHNLQPATSSQPSGSASVLASLNGWRENNLIKVNGGNNNLQMDGSKIL